jgi:hypothetical protein
VRKQRFAASLREPFCTIQQKLFSCRSSIKIL